MVDLRAEAPAAERRWPDGVTVHRIGLVDHGTPSLEELARAATVVKELWQAGETVFVHCHAGIERTPMVVCAALVSTGWSLAEAYRTIRERRPSILPRPGQMRVLEEFAARVAAPKEA